MCRVEREREREVEVMGERSESERECVCVRGGGGGIKRMKGESSPCEVNMEKWCELGSHCWDRKTHLAMKT